MASLRKALLACGLVGLLATTPDHVAAQDWHDVRAGLDALAAGQLDAAADRFVEAAKAPPMAGLANYNLGLVRARQHRLDEAARAFGEAVTLLPENRRSGAYYNLGVVLAERGELEPALREFASALRLDPADDNARVNFAITQARIARIRATSSDSASAGAVRRILDRTPDQTFAFVTGGRSARRPSPDGDW